MHLSPHNKNIYISEGRNKLDAYTSKMPEKAYSKPCIKLMVEAN